MQSENRFFDDLVKLMNGVAGTVAGAGREAEGQVREKMKGVFGGMDFVSREEFDAVKAMAAAARAAIRKPTTPDNVVARSGPGAARLRVDRVLHSFVTSAP